MASLADILATVQQGVTAANGLVKQMTGSLNNIASTNISITYFGGVGDGVTDNTAALNAALASLSGNGGSVYFPPGNFKFLTAISYTVASIPGSVTFKGAGADVTTLFFPSTNGIIIDLSSPYQTFHVRDLTFASGTSSGLLSGLIINQSSPEGAFFQSDVTGVNFRANIPGGTGWGNGFVSNGASATSFVSDYFLNNTNAINLGPSVNSPFFGQDYNITNCTFFGGTTGILYGSDIQAVEVSNNYFVNLTSALVVPGGAVGFLEGLQFTGNSVAVTGTGINLNAAVSQVTITGNLFTSATANTNLLISLGVASGFTIVGNTFSGTGGGGMSGITVFATTAGTGGTIVGNSFQSLNAAVTLAGGTSGINVQSNVYVGNSSNVTNGSSASTVGGGSP